jgi:SpoVK/Ycf46/Vps4 family AAA+-type ATPase
MRKIKNEFMSMWDGLRSRDGERVLVLAATNRPFDLDDAVLVSYFFNFILNKKII